MFRSRYLLTEAPSKPIQNLINKVSNVESTPKAFSPLIEKFRGLDYASHKIVMQHNVQEAMQKYQIHKTDTGSTSVQVAIASEKIQNLTRHLTRFPLDNVAKRSFQLLVQDRRKLLKYLKRDNYVQYTTVCHDLGIKPKNENL